MLITYMRVADKRSQVGIGVDCKTAADMVGDRWIFVLSDFILDVLVYLWFCIGGLLLLLRPCHESGGTQHVTALISVAPFFISPSWSSSPRRISNAVQFCLETWSAARPPLMLPEKYPTCRLQSCLGSCGESPRRANHSLGNSNSEEKNSIMCKNSQSRLTESVRAPPIARPGVGNMRAGCEGDSVSVSPSQVKVSQDEEQRTIENTLTDWISAC